MKLCWIVIAALVASNVPAADWPQWRGPNRNGLSSEKVSAVWPDEGPQVLWRAPLGTGFSSVSISQGRLYTLGNTNNEDTVWCFDARTGGFFYQPNRQFSFACTAAAIYSLQVLGHYDDPQVQSGADYLAKHFQEKGGYVAYGHFYAGPAAYMLGGEMWKSWYTNLSEELLKTAHRDGAVVSWEKQGSDPNPTYCTAVYTTILALPYHYVPLYQR